MILKCLRIGLGALLICTAFAFPAGAQAPLADRSILTRFHSPTFGDPAAKVEIVEFFVNRRPLVDLGYEELRALGVEEIRRSYATGAKK